MIIRDRTSGDLAQRLGGRGSPACSTNASTRDMIRFFKHRLESHFRRATLVLW